MIPNWTLPLSSITQSWITEHRNLTNPCGVAVSSLRDSFLLDIPILLDSRLNSDILFVNVREVGVVGI
jgi:hypothetical protein